MRLIDADAFLKRIQNDTSLCAELKLYVLKILKRYLDLQPTAYSVDKVVEELNNVSFLSETRHCENGFPIDNVVLLDKAIEIVKQGGCK